MAQPTQSDLQSNLIAFEGAPFMPTGISTAITDNNLIAFEGAPFIVPFAAAATGTAKFIIITTIFG